LLCLQSTLSSRTEPRLGTYLLLVWSRQDSVGFPLTGAGGEALKPLPFTTYDEKFLKIVLDRGLNIWYNRDMNNAFKIAMELSNGSFAYYLCGVLNTLSDNGDKAPVPETEAREYLDTFHEGWEIHAEGWDPDEDPDEDEDDEQALASAGFGMDESYNDGGAYREDFGYFGEMGMMED